MLRSIIPLLLAGSFTLCSAESRTWRNNEGTKSFEAEFVTRKDDKVTLLRADGSKLTFDISKLHEEDQQWLILKHLAVKADAGDGGAEKVSAYNPVFDTLVFGDNRNTVTEKLNSSKIVDNTIGGTFLGRTGLNGIFHTSHKIGGLHCYLFFDWEDDGGLKEITLQTESKDSAEYSTVLEPCWKELIDLISPIHGKPIQHMPLAARDALQDGQMLATHLWRMDQGGTVLLGTSQLGKGYQVVVRFTEEKIEPNRIP